MSLSSSWKVARHISNIMETTLNLTSVKSKFVFPWNVTKVNSIEMRIVYTACRLKPFLLNTRDFITPHWEAVRYCLNPLLAACAQVYWGIGKVSWNPSLPLFPLLPQNQQLCSLRLVLSSLGTSWLVCASITWKELWGNLVVFPQPYCCLDEG